MENHNSLKTESEDPRSPIQPLDAFHSNAWEWGWESKRSGSSLDNTADNL